MMTWEDTKHFSFDVRRYAIDNGTLTVETGFLSKTVEAIPLYRITSAQLHRTLLQRIMGICTITLHILDGSTDIIFLQNIYYDDGEMYRELVQQIENAFYDSIYFRRRNIHTERGFTEDAFLDLHQLK
ncbi:PH domain-containing protein [Ruminococcus flavefaciens]|uniref:PH domain-containing protein n=1 Tax=Ruminococcus flavefaciens TaxID=1265 RepID=UPI0026EE5408|nr:PH domain-containing protein [Ruminococcus flavefaciens]